MAATSCPSSGRRKAWSAAGALVPSRGTSRRSGFRAVTHCKGTAGAPRTGGRTPHWSEPNAKPGLQRGAPGGDLGDLAAADDDVGDRQGRLDPGTQLQIEGAEWPRQLAERADGRKEAMASDRIGIVAGKVCDRFVPT